MSLTSVSRATEMNVADLQDQEKETADLPLSLLYLWSKVLRVPVTELLVEPDDGLSKPVLGKTAMIHLMKTALEIRETARSDATRLLAENLIGQLTAIMPELANISPDCNGARRDAIDRTGRNDQNPMPDDWFVDLG